MISGGRGLMRSWMEDRCNPRRVAGKSEHSIYFDEINSSFPNKCLLLFIYTRLNSTQNPKRSRQPPSSQPHSQNAH